MWSLPPPSSTHIPLEFAIHVCYIFSDLSLKKEQVLALRAPHYCFGKGNHWTPPSKKTAYINLALEFKLPHIGFYLDFWFQGWASNRGNHITPNSYLQVDVKPTSPFIHPHTFRFCNSFVLYFQWFIIERGTGACPQGTPLLLWKRQPLEPPLEQTRLY